MKGTPIMFGISTIERWYYAARRAPQDPLSALRRHARKDLGTHPSMVAKLRTALAAQYECHRGWSYKLHADNLAAMVRKDAKLGPMPSYSTVRRYMRDVGLTKKRTEKQRLTVGAERAAQRLERREVRSYEMEHVHALWHCDFHVGSLDVITSAGQWETPVLFAALDDCSRICCHAQWYLGSENTEKLVHGLSQAILKRGMLRALMSDNGSGMIAAETTEGLKRLSVIHEPTLAESPYQNGKQESWWNQVEGRLLAMLEGEPRLTLELLNEATQAWVELEYHRQLHSDLGVTPMERFLTAPNVGRPSPTSAELRAAFRMTAERTPRKSDGTVSIAARRYEVPNRYRHLSKVAVRYPRWDLSYVDMVDLPSDRVLCPLQPLDKHANADGRRRSLDPIASAASNDPVPLSGMAPLLSEIIEQHRATGLPPAYLPLRNNNKETTNE